MEVLNNHRTIRNFTNQKVSNSTLNSIINSGTRASTTGNMQLYSVIVTKEGDKKKQLAPLHFNQALLKSAPVLLTVLADFNRFTKWCKINSAKPFYDNFLSFYTASIDALLFAQNVCVAAENLGLGICYLGTTTYNCREIIQLLELPKLTFPVTTIALGYPAESPEQSDKISLEGIIHEEVYKDYTDSDIKDLYTMKENLESSKKFVEENKKENLAQVFTDIRYKRKDNIFFSEKFIEVLREQGFML